MCNFCAKFFEEKAAALDMTVEEFKKCLAERKKAFYEDFKAEAEAKGMTEKEYKENNLALKMRDCFCFLL